MTDLVLQSRTLPEPLFRLIRTERVKIRESHGEIHLIPIDEPSEDRLVLPILGMYSDDKLTVEKHHEWGRASKELEL